MTGNGGFTRYLLLALALWLAFLSRPSSVSAWSHPGTAEPLTLGEEAKDHISDKSERQYRRFTLPARGKVNVKFTYYVTTSRTDPAWMISLLDMDLVKKLELVSYRTEEGEGVTGSVDLDAGDYYLLVEGNLSNAIGPDYYLLASLNTPNVKLLDTQQTYPMIGEAYQKATNDSTIVCSNLIFQEELLIDQEIVVTIDGGKDKFFNETIGFTTIRGSLTLKNGKVKVNRLVIR